MTTRPLIIALFAASASIGPLASAQVPAPGDMDMNGRVLAKVTVTMTDPNSYGRTVTGFLFRIIGENGDEISVRTDDTGSARAWLLPCSYRFVTPEPLRWQNSAYTWDLVMPIRAGTGLIRLSQANAASVVGPASPTSPTSPTSPAASAPRPAAPEPPRTIE